MREGARHVVLCWFATLCVPKKHNDVVDMSWTVSLGISGVAYLYPVYATYKALTAATRGGTTPVAYAWKEGVGASTKAKEPPTHLSELETWTMYWCVMGIMWLYNLWIEWLLRWYV